MDYVVLVERPGRPPFVEYVFPSKAKAQQRAAEILRMQRSWPQWWGVEIVPQTTVEVISAGPKSSTTLSVDP